MQPVREPDAEDRKHLQQVRGGHQCREVGADRVKGDKAHVQQAGIADHNIKPERQHDVEQGEVDDAHPVVAAKLRGYHGRNQQREAEQAHA